MLAKQECMLFFSLILAQIPQSMLIKEHELEYT